MIYERALACMCVLTHTCVHKNTELDIHSADFSLVRHLGLGNSFAMGQYAMLMVRQSWELCNRQALRLLCM